MHKPILNGDALQTLVVVRDISKEIECDTARPDLSARSCSALVDGIESVRKVWLFVSHLETTLNTYVSVCENSIGCGRPWQT